MAAILLCREQHDTCQPESTIFAGLSAAPVEITAGPIQQPPHKACTGDELLSLDKNPSLQLRTRLQLLAILSPLPLPELQFPFYSSIFHLSSQASGEGKGLQQKSAVIISSSPTATQLVPPHIMDNLKQIQSTAVQRKGKFQIS